MKREFKSYLLLVICVLTQVVAVFPHHHHADNLCLQSDWEVLCAVHGEKDSCPHDVPAENAAHNCCGGSCATNLQFASSDNHSADVSPDYSFYSILYSFLTTCRTWMLPEVSSSQEKGIYVERLYARNVLRASGLRAPPSFFFSL